MKTTVIAAVYNSEATVEEAISSIGAQSHLDLEHLIIEGKSKDSSLAAIKAAAHDRGWFWSVSWTRAFMTR